MVFFPTVQGKRSFRTAGKVERLVGACSEVSCQHLCVWQAGGRVTCSPHIGACACGARCTMSTRVTLGLDGMQRILSVLWVILIDGLSSSGTTQEGLGIDWFAGWYRQKAVFGLTGLY